MVVAAIYDIHGNLPALEAVLADPRLEQADTLVCGGDLVAGPMPAECLDLLTALGSRVRFLRGNGDREVASATPADPVGAGPGWCAERLGRERLTLVRSWPLTIDLAVDGLGRVLFCHAVPNDDAPILTTLTPLDEVERELCGVEADVIVCGHVHVQYERALGDGRRLVNAGSVGAPYGGPAGAQWLLLDQGIAPVHTPYDVEAAIVSLGACAYPGFADWLPPALRGEVTAEQAMAEFEAMRGA